MNADSAPDRERDRFLYPLLDILCARSTPIIERDMSTVDTVEEIGNAVVMRVDFLPSRAPCRRLTPRSSLMFELRVLDLAPSVIGGDGEEEAKPDA